MSKRTKLFVKLTSEEKGLFSNLFQYVSKGNNEKLEAKDAGNFMRKSGLPKQKLKEIWIISCQTNPSYLYKDEFYLALRLIALAQNGYDINRESIINNQPIPPLPNFNNNINQNQGDPYELNETNKIKFKGYFDKNKDSPGYKITGNKVVYMWRSTNADDATIQQIINLLKPFEERGFFNLREFQVGTKLLSLSKTYGIPNTLPVSLAKYLGRSGGVAGVGNLRGRSPNPGSGLMRNQNPLEISNMNILQTLNNESSNRFNNVLNRINNTQSQTKRTSNSNQDLINFNSNKGINESNNICMNSIEVTSINKISSFSPSLTNKNQNLEEKFDEITKKMTLLDADFKAVNNRIFNVKKELENLKEKQGKIKEEMDELLENIENLNREIKAKSEDLYKNNNSYGNKNNNTIGNYQTSNTIEGSRNNYITVVDDNNKTVGNDNINHFDSDNNNKNCYDNNCKNYNQNSISSEYEELKHKKEALQNLMDKMTLAMMNPNKNLQNIPKNNEGNQYNYNDENLNTFNKAEFKIEQANENVNNNNNNCNEKINNTNNINDDVHYNSAIVTNDFSNSQNVPNVNEIINSCNENNGDNNGKLEMKDNKENNENNFLNGTDDKSNEILNPYNINNNTEINQPNNNDSDKINIKNECINNSNNNQINITNIKNPYESINLDNKLSQEQNKINSYGINCSPIPKKLSGNDFEFEKINENNNLENNGKNQIENPFTVLNTAENAENKVENNEEVEEKDSFWD